MQLLKNILAFSTVFGSVVADMQTCLSQTRLYAPGRASGGDGTVRIDPGDPNARSLYYAFQVPGTTCNGNTISAQVLRDSDGSFVKKCAAKSLYASPGTISYSAGADCFWDATAYEPGVNYRFVSIITDGSGNTLAFPVYLFHIKYYYNYECSYTVTASGLDAKVLSTDLTTTFNINYNGFYCAGLRFSAILIGPKQYWFCYPPGGSTQNPDIVATSSGVSPVVCANTPAGMNANTLYIDTPKSNINIKPRYKISYSPSASLCAGNATSTTGTSTNIASTSTQPFSMTFTVPPGSCSTSSGGVTIANPKLAFTNSAKRDVTKTYDCQAGTATDDSVQIVCPTVKEGTMATYGTYVVSFDACDAGGCTTASQPFVVTHADNPTFTGGLRRRSLCTPGLSACTTDDGGYECIDVYNDIWSCGGCRGVDCTTMPSAMDVSCRSGGCIINTCEWGFELRDNECWLVDESPV